jgi:hypothetical protein
MDRPVEKAELPEADFVDQAAEIPAFPLAGGEAVKKISFDDGASRQIQAVHD